MLTRTSSITVMIAILALLLAAGALIAMLFRPRTIAAAPEASFVRQITVIGQGETTAVPDTAVVQMGVQTEADTAREALTENNVSAEALIAKLRELGIDERDIQTSSINIWPRYDSRGNNITGYQVTNSVTIKIRNIEQTGELLDQVVDVGANNISGIAFTIDDPAALQRDARNEALSDARARAEALAQASGTTLGQVLSINENVGAAPPVPYYAATIEAEAAGDSRVPVQPGEQNITAQLQVTFELR
jgi:uncharacterized protein YggE